MTRRALLHQTVEDEMQLAAGIRHVPFATQVPISFIPCTGYSGKCLWSSL